MFTAHWKGVCAKEKVENVGEREGLSRGGGDRSWTKDWSGHLICLPEKDEKAEAWSRTEMSQWTSELGFDPGSL